MKKNVLIDSVAFSASRYVIFGLSAIRNIVLGRVLGPVLNADWQVVILVLMFSDQIHLGLRHAGDKEVPFLEGRDGPEAAGKALNALFGGIALLSVLGILLVTAYSFIKDPGDGQLRHSLYLAALLVATDQISRFYLMALRTRREFVLSSKIEVMIEALRTALMCVLAYYFHLVGGVLAFLLASASMSVFFILRFGNSIRPTFDWSILKQLWKIGFPLFLSSATYILILNFDRIAGERILEKRDFGLYGIAMTLAQLPVSFALSIRDVLYPGMSEEFGRTGDLSLLAPTYRSALIITGVLLPLFVGGVLFVSEITIHLVLPKYIDGISPLYVIGTGVYFLALAALPSGVMMSTGRNSRFLMTEAAAVLIAVAVFAALGFKADMTGLAAVTVVLYVVFGIFSMERTEALFGASPFHRLRSIVPVTIPSLYAACLVGCIHWYASPMLERMGFDPVIRVGIQTLAFLAAYAPVLFVANKRYALIERVRAVLRSSETSDGSSA